MGESSAPAAGKSMRSERDRFVALAFSWADMLVELDGDGKVVFSAGPTALLLGRTPEDLLGMAAGELAAEVDRPLMARLLRIAAKKERFDPVTIRMRAAAGDPVPLTVAGHRLEDLDGHYFLAFRMGAPEPKVEAPRTGAGGLYDARSFSEVAARALEGEKENRLSLVALPDYESLSRRLDEDAEEELKDAIGACLKAGSVDGGSAAFLSEGRYGLIHDADFDLDDLGIQIAEITSKADPAGKGVAVESATVEGGGVSASGEELANGLVYVINRFRTAKGSDFTISSFSTDISSLVSEASEAVNEFKRAVAATDFDVHFQPIIEVAGGGIHHYEALCRFRAGAKGRTTFEYMSFAEETGLIAEFDLAMAKKAVNLLANLPRGVRIAINVSGHSVEDLDYVSGLHALLRANAWARGRILFEITESARMGDLTAANRFIQGLRGQGCEVCLDDFGAGAANFQYLSALEVDVVKLDGAAIRHAQKARKGTAFLKALVGLCRDLQVETIAEMIEDEKGFEFVKKCRVQYVQGYLFGKPSPDITSFSSARTKRLVQAMEGRR
ncbi:MAG: EAL domain-containing protein [Proteobacteria bacterium]|nr:EAL domain-containing protein [Pseudomonadota bacterium]